MIPRILFCEYLAFAPKLSKFFCGSLSMLLKVDFRLS